jgi:inner membrane transporter RhtA
VGALLRVPPVVLVLTAITTLQFGAALGATLIDDVGAAGAALLRLAFAAAILLAVWRPRVAGRERGDLWLAAAFGATLGGMNLAIYEAIERIPLGIAVTIEFAGPLAVAVLASRRRLDMLWAVLAAAGIVVLADPGGGDVELAGVLFALVAAICWAAYIVIAARAGQRFRGGEGLTLAMTLGVLVPLVPGIVSGGTGLLDGEVLAIAFCVALLSSVIPYSLETEALRRMPKNVFGVLMSLEPAVAAFAGFLVLSQDLGLRELVAIGLVVTASAGATRFAPAPPEPAQAIG